MKTLLIANTLFEGAVGILAIAAPLLLWAAADGLGVSIARAFGCALLAAALLSALALRNLDNRAAMILALAPLAFMHVALAVAEFSAFLQGHALLPVVIVHSLFGLAFVVALMGTRVRGERPPE